MHELLCDAAEIRGGAIAYYEIAAAKTAARDPAAASGCCEESADVCAKPSCSFPDASRNYFRHAFCRDDCARGNSRAPRAGAEFRGARGAAVFHVAEFGQPGNGSLQNAGNGDV